MLFVDEMEEETWNQLKCPDVEVEMIVDLFHTLYGKTIEATFNDSIDIFNDDS